MRLAVSNIAWAPEEEPAVVELLRARGVRGVEIAPSVIWPGWRGMSQAAATAVAGRYARAGLEVPALQALLYGRPDLQLFGPSEALLAHMTEIAAIARRLGARCLVFGAPKNRDPGTLDAAAAWALAAERFRRLGEACAREDVILGIEANPPAYGCTFLTRWAEAARMVRAVDHPGVGLHLDVACTVMAGDDPARALEEAADIICHVHISEPGLGDFAEPEIDHARVGKALAKSSYKGWLSIEMRRSVTPLAAIDRAITIATANYPSLGLQSS